MASWFNNLIPKKKKNHNRVLGVSITPQGAAWCVLESGAPARMTASATLEGEFKTPAEALVALLQHSAPPALPCHVSLSHHFYQMLLVDSPNVPDNELREAVTWRVKDLITQPIESMVVDVFRLPADAYRGRMHMVYAALMERAYVSAVVKACYRFDLELQSVGIAELALAQMSAHLTEFANRSLALLHLTESTGSINMAENGLLYLTRSLEMQGATVYGGASDAQQDPTDNLALDIQRSLDYYESQLGKSGVSRVYLISESLEQLHWCEALSQRLPVKAEAFSLAKVMNLEGELSTLEQGLLTPAVGIALGGMHAGA